MDAGEWVRWAAAFFPGALSTVLVEFGRGQLERRQRLNDRRDDFQRETLVEPQEMLEKMITATVAIQSFNELDEEAYAAVMEPIKPGGRRLPDEAEWAEQETMAAIRVRTLYVRVHDDEVRGLVADFIKLVPDTTAATPIAESTAQTERAVATSRAANTRIGELPRKL